MGTIEKLLIDNGFELETWYGEAKRYRLKIGHYQYAYVRIFADVNEIHHVEYESGIPWPGGYIKKEKASIEFVNTYERLKSFIEAVKP